MDREDILEQNLKLKFEIDTADPKVFPFIRMADFICVLEDELIQADKDRDENRKGDKTIMRIPANMT